MCQWHPGLHVDWPVLVRQSDDVVGWTLGKPEGKTRHTVEPKEQTFKLIIIPHDKIKS